MAISLKPFRITHYSNILQKCEIVVINFQIISLQALNNPMFLWCCPWRKKNTTKPEIQQSLIESSGSHITSRENTSAQSKPSSQTLKEIEDVEKVQKNSNDGTKSQPYDNKDMEQPNYQQRINRTETKLKSQNSGVAPHFSKMDSLRPFSPRDNQKSMGAPKKSHLWKQQLKSDLIYIDPSAPNYVYMNYRLTKNQQTKDCLNGLDYFLSKSQDRFHVIIGKQSVINSKISTLNKYSFNAITGVIVRQGRATEQNVGLAQAILIEDLRCFRWNGVSSLVIMADCFHSLAEVKDFFNSFIKDLGWEELKKATFLFPAFLTLEEISQILFANMRQYVINSTIQKVSIDLVFDMELIEGANLDCCIIIKTRSEEAKQSNSVYDHLKMSMVFFAKELSQLTQRVFIDFYIQSKEKSLKEYFETKEFYRKNPSQFRGKVKKMKDLEPKVITDFDNSPTLKQIMCDDSGYYFVIPSKVREQIGRIYNIPQLQKKQVDTPIKKQWDDDATADDFKTGKTNKLDMVAKQQLDQIDLDMGLGNLSDSDQNPQENYDENEIVINVSETKGKEDKDDLQI